MSKAEKILGPSLLRSVQRRMPEGGPLSIPKRGPKDKGGQPKKRERNAAICEAVAGGTTQAKLARDHGLTEGRISTIVKAGRANAWD